MAASSSPFVAYEGDDTCGGEGCPIPEVSGPRQVAVFRHRVRGDAAPVCITSGSGPRQRSYDLSGWRLLLRGSDPDFNLQRSYRNLDNPFMGWNVRFLSSTAFEAEWVQSDASGDRVVNVVRGRYRWVPNAHTRNGALELLVEEGLPLSASDYGRVLALTINGDDPLATSSWGPIYALFDPARFPSPGALYEHAMMQQTIRPRYNEDRYVSSTGAFTTPAPGLWTVGVAPETATHLAQLAQTSPRSS
jgi:hypothetical protein